MLDVLGQVQASLQVKRTSIVEFVESDEFCDKKLYPRQRILLKLFFLEELTGKEEDVLDFWIAGGTGGDEITISPNIRERIQWLRDHDYPHFREISLVGGRRSSKGWLTGVALAKVMYDCLQLQDPGTYYGIDPTKDIYFSCIAGSEGQAREFQYADFSSTVETCKAFEPYLLKSLETEFRVATQTDLRVMQGLKARGNKIQKDIARIRGKALAANAGTLRGSATMAFCIDEMAHMLEGISKSTADAVYEAAEPALDQFREDGMIFCNSSPYTKIGKFYERWVEAMKPFDPEDDPDHEDSGDARLLAFQYPSWALFEGYQEEKQHQWVITASPDWDSEEKNEDGTDKWSKQDKTAIALARSKERSDPEGYKVERRAKWAEVVDAYLIPQMVDRMYEGRPIGFEGEDNSPIFMPYEPDPGGITAHNFFRYKMHLDPSSTTAGFGFAIGHTEEFMNPQGVGEEHVVFDLIKRWNPAEFPGGAIKWDTVFEELLGYIELFRPYEVTFDQYESSKPIQDLQREVRTRGISGIQIREITATPEINWKRAEQFKTALYHGYVHAPRGTPDIELSSKELKFLQKVNQNSKYPKVEKQTSGPVKTKDMADCIMEVARALIGDTIAKQIAEQMTQPGGVMTGGAAGGYRIGGPDTGGRGDVRGTPMGSGGRITEGGRVGEQRRTIGTDRRVGISIGGGNRRWGRGMSRR